MNKNQNTERTRFEGYYYQHTMPEFLKTVVELLSICKDEVELREKLRERFIEYGEEFLHSKASCFLGNTPAALWLHSNIDARAGAAKLNNHLQAEEEREKIKMANSRVYECFMRTVRRNPWGPR